MTESEMLILYCSLGFILIMLAAGGICLLIIRHREKRLKAERQYRQARKLAKDFINAQLVYSNSVRAIDDATIEAFETIIEEIAKTRRLIPDQTEQNE